MGGARRRRWVMSAGRTKGHGQGGMGQDFSQGLAMLASHLTSQMGLGLGRLSPPPLGPCSSHSTLPH